MIKLSVEEGKGCLVEQAIAYNEKEMGFVSLKRAPVCVSLLVAYVEIEFDSNDMCAKAVCGLAPKSAWKSVKLYEPQNVLKCALKLEENVEWGVYRLDGGNEWEIFYDDETGWVCIGEPNGNSRDTNINFISNVIAVLDEKRGLKALWIKPATK